MALKPGSRIGPYEIVSLAGTGGMGEVYKARDTRLERTVALKILPASLAAHSDRRERFEREARAVSALSHPHICTLYDIGRQDGVDFLVMEYVEGETLAERLARGALPLEQALRCGIEIASALDTAHRHGIIHRDLKPGNIILTKSATKLLDFGLAKLREPSPGQGGPRSGVPGPAAPGIDNPRLSEIPTRSQPLTAEGTLLGTLQYMAPEQLEGKEADARTDIFAFGIVLYEMVTGKKAFEGKSQASLIAAILEREPAPVSALQPMTPPALERAVTTCLAKDPDERWQSAHDLERELRWIAESGSPAPAQAPGAARILPRRRIASISMAFALGAALASTVFLTRREERPRQIVVSSLLLPEEAPYDPNAGPMALSPDGRHLAFIGRSAEGKRSLWVRSLDRPAARPLAGTEGATTPFWSPDSRFLGFFAEGRLKKIDASGGLPETLCAAPLGGTGAWSQQGVILFATVDQPIQRVPASGGAPTSVTRFDKVSGETGHFWPSFLPDGDHFIYRASAPSSARMHTLYVASLEGGEPRPLLTAQSNAVYAPAGYLLFWREGSLRAHRFDPKRLEFEGEAVTVAPEAQLNPAIGAALFSVSESGLLAYSAGTGAGLHQLVWYDRGGKAIGSVGSPANYYTPRISRDGRRVAVDISDVQNNGDIWIYDLTRPVATRFTFDPANESSPIWSPGDERLVFFSQKEGRLGDLFQRSVSGAGADELLFESGTFKMPSDWSRDGSWFAFNNNSQESGTKTDIWIFSVAQKKATPYLTTPFEEWDPQFSPDGRWIMYVSDESGRNEVYVQPYPGPGPRSQISTAGGTMPLWSRDGREIFFVAPDSHLMAVAVTTTPRFEPGAPKPLFKARFKDFTPVRQYDISLDGQRFLINTPAEGESAAAITLVINWDAALPK